MAAEAYVTYSSMRGGLTYGGSLDPEQITLKLAKSKFTGGVFDLVIELHSRRNMYVRRLLITMPAKIARKIGLEMATIANMQLSNVSVRPFPESNDLMNAEATLNYAETNQQYTGYFLLEEVSVSLEDDIIGMNLESSHLNSGIASVRIKLPIDTANAIGRVMKDCLSLANAEIVIHP